jgi:glycosyltransferase involved in cell wall biosynthesis
MNNNLKKEFDWNLYLHLNPNLKPLIKSEQAAWNHFKNYGFKENFKYKINNDDKKILVVMPTYNRPNNIDASIHMILEQTFTNWFFLIIDDGSHIDNKLIFRQVKEKYKENHNIVFLENEVNCHIAKTLNRGIKILLDNDFTHFTWISDDNVYYPNFLDTLASNNIFFNYTSFKIHNKCKNLKYINKSSYNNYKHLIQRWNGCASFMWTKEAIQQIGYYNEDIHGCEDFEYLIRTFKINSIDCKFINISLMTYFIRNSSLFMTQNDAIIKLKNILSQYYLEHENATCYIYLV